MKTRYEISPRTLCLIKNEENILLIKYSEKKWDMYGFFNALWGHIEIGEGVIESANREIYEESWLKPDNTKLKWIIHFTNFFGKNGMMFITISETKETKVIESDEGKLHWININKLDKINVFDDIKIIVSKIIELEKNEVFTGKIEFDGKWGLVKIEFE